VAAKTHNSPLLAASLGALLLILSATGCSSGSSRTSRAPGTGAFGSSTRTGTQTGTGTGTTTGTGTETTTSIGTDTGTETTEGVVTLTASDGGTVAANLVKATGTSKKVLLLFHQAESNRHEYESLQDVFSGWGWDNLAVDLRSGGDAYGSSNETVKARGSSTGEDYGAAKPDLVVAIAWAKQKGYETIVLVGSSYSAALIIVLATTDGVDGVAAFSPGDFLDPAGSTKTAAAAVAVPFYATGAADEEDQTDDIVEGLTDVTRFKNPNGIHGASTMREDDNPAGFQAARDSFEDFLSEVGN
jgi:pimeloyl-ACP methyl ester carboxylesterase